MSTVDETMTLEESQQPETVSKIEQIDMCTMWDNTQPKKVGASWEFGSHNFTKMLVFLKDSKFSKEDLKHYLDLPLARADDEDYFYYRTRRKFCSQLEKFRIHVKAFIMMGMMQKFIDDQKAKEIKDNPVIKEIDNIKSKENV